MAQVVATMQEIAASSRKIADIIGVIDDIASQTNVLALNAAVEAAREIKGLIGDSAEKVETGSRLVGDAGQTMDDIVAQVRTVSDLIGRISQATQDQTSGIGEVGHAVGSVDQSTQQNAALVEQRAAAAESLRQQAAQRADIVRVFKLAAA